MIADRVAGDPRAEMARGGLVALLAVAGALHLFLTPAHLAESALFGFGFIAAGILELGLAAAVVARPLRGAYVIVIVVAATLVALYAYNVLVRLPIAEDAAHEVGTHESPAAAEGSDHATASHGSEGLVLGTGEPIDAAGAATKAAELASIGIAVSLLLRDRRGDVTSPSH